MGSYLSIENNTSDPWTCTIGPDEAALKIAGIVISVIGAAATVIGTAGAAAPVASALVANGVVSVFGVSTSALSVATAAAAGTIGTVASVGGTVSGFGIAVAQGVSDHLVSDGYVTIAAGQKHQWGKMSLSLWQQGTCVKTTIVDETTVTTDTLYMRPIFSGATDNSNIDHQIQFWIDKWGTESQEVKGTTDAQSRRAKRAKVGPIKAVRTADNYKDIDDDESYDSYDSYDDDETDADEDETVYFYANGSNTYTGSRH